MSLISETTALVKKEFLLEFRLRYMFNAVLVYLAGAIFICYFAFFGRGGDLSPMTWNALFWIIVLLASVNAASRSFLLERPSRQYYYYFMASPGAIILSKLIYNIVLLSLMALLGLLLFAFVMGNVVQDMGMFVAIALIGASCLAATLTFIAAIAAQTQHSMTLMAVLSFPVVIPVLLILIKVSKSAIDGLERSLSYQDLLVLIAVKVITITVSYLLFPYLWKN
ncbi:heme exporter protein CcmB [Cytophaga hutchinsonii]|uniref:Possible ABC transport permease, cytochrome c biogenesis n=1 Tax=Cytophaga hutchinsonii (strain ATCC 33406 / DSM 1761 / CIP 103989 / NBRC 15051 / NCIMB 9469 / D465) TaxID=269798 RepID=A0A6N4SVJ5_CYTH3|nr:heme exporter protein CcmB [Cytophaga hutchinsonii]ABG60486.1 possible ABC transport permease, cytochrome c biogenesis [Cytophaga hutchinsonii ATCC 33406]SFX84916.1 heme exporter protein B [Cytophaga hutchinsonii ATCC 33406]